MTKENSKQNPVYIGEDGLFWHANKDVLTDNSINTMVCHAFCVGVISREVMDAEDLSDEDIDFITSAWAECEPIFLPMLGDDEVLVEKDSK